MSNRFHRDHLADGREIIYVDDADTSLPAERKVDQRDLPGRPATARMRKDVLTGEWVSIASARQHRVFLPPADADPLAPQTAKNPSEVPDNYDVVVFENRSPSFGPDENFEQAADVEKLAFGYELPAVGRCEVVCFSPDHHGSFGSLTAQRARTVLEAWSQRSAELLARDDIRQVFVFENRGEEIGVTLPHPHGQIYAYPFVTPKTTRLLESVAVMGPSFFADLVDFELAGPRIVTETDHFVAFVPFAARWPLELHLLPKRQVPDIPSLTLDEKDDLATVYLNLVRSFDALYDTPTPYIAAWHQAPKVDNRDQVRLMVQITSPRRAVDKLKYLAGSEAAMGAFIGDISPEDQAEQFRQALATVSS